LQTRWFYDFVSHEGASIKGTLLQLKYATFNVFMIIFFFLLIEIQRHVWQLSNPFYDLLCVDVYCSKEFLSIWNASDFNLQIGFFFLFCQNKVSFLKLLRKQNEWTMMNVNSVNQSIRAIQWRLKIIERSIPHCLLHSCRKKFNFCLLFVYSWKSAQISLAVYFNRIFTLFIRLCACHFEIWIWELILLFSFIERIFILSLRIVWCIK
jgi:hypothetical protein